MNLTNRSVQVILILGLIAISLFFIKPVLFPNQVPDQHKELLIYCGITMIKPITEIASIIEKQEGVKISIIKGGSGNLLNAIEFNGVGDLFLPGSDSYIKSAREKGLITETAHVGYNRAAMIVQKDNPKNISPTLDSMKSASYYVVIGNPDSGSIGKETKHILTSAGIFDEVLKNTVEMTTDSKRLSEVLINGEADIVINWHAVSTWGANTDFIEVLPIDEQYAQKKRLVLGLLNTSKYPIIARKLMAYASSEKGIKIFDRYGLYHLE